jgi:IS5 family transposase
MSQLSFSDVEFGAKRKQTRREKFLTEMDKVVPWARLSALIEPVYPKGKGGRPPYALEKMLRIHFMQQWFALSDPAMEEALYDMQSMRQFANLSLTRGGIPDETTILNFRHLLEEHKLVHGEEEAVFGDAGYTGVEKREDTKHIKATWHVAMKPSKRKAIKSEIKRMSNTVEKLEYLKASVRSKVEHQFRIIKCQFGYQKTRYKGLIKNTAQIVTLFALSNVWLVRNKLRPTG